MFLLSRQLTVKTLNGRYFVGTLQVLIFKSLKFRILNFHTCEGDFSTRYIFTAALV